MLLIRGSKASYRVLREEGPTQLLISRGMLLIRGSKASCRGRGSRVTVDWPGGGIKGPAGLPGVQGAEEVREGGVTV